MGDKKNYEAYKLVKKIKSKIKFDILSHEKIYFELIYTYGHYSCTNTRNIIK